MKNKITLAILFATLLAACQNGCGSSDGGFSDPPTITLDDGNGGVAGVGGETN